MKKRQWYRDYERREREIANKFAPKAMAGDFVKNAQELYRDRTLSTRVAFHRSGAPLSALLFLYEQVVVYVPPATKETLRARLGIAWDDFVALTEKRCIIPVIGKPANYARQKHFGALFELAPASVWARGDELALEFANGHDYWSKVNHDHPSGSLPVDPLTKAKYRQHFPLLESAALERRIDHEIRTNYVDLCIYGFEPLADFLLSPGAGADGTRKLLQISELVTYPSLMGMGGTPNYGLESGNAASMAMAAPQLRPALRHVGPEAALLVEGLSLATPAHIDPRLVIDFHKDSMAATLWDALGALETKLDASYADADDLVARADSARFAINEALREVNGAGYILRNKKALDRFDNLARFTVKLSPLLPLATLIWSPFDQQLLDGAVHMVGVVGAAASYHHRNAIANTLQLQLAHHLSSRQLDGMATQLWWLTKWTANRSA